MHYTSLDIAPKYKNRIVTGYDKDSKAVPIMNVGIDVAAGGMLSNTFDLAKYLKLQLTYNNLQDKSVDPTLRGSLNIVHNNFYCVYSKQVYQQLAWEFHPLSELDVSYQPNKEGQSIIMPHRLPSNCPLYTGNGFIDKTGNAKGMSSYIAYIPGKVGVVILVNNALKPQIVDLGRYILKNSQK